MTTENALTLEDLRRILRESAGEDESVDLDQEILDVSFTDLGYDSLALLETIGRISREYQVSLPDEVLDRVDTPRAFVEYVNRTLAQA